MHWLTYWTILPWNGKTQYVQSGQFWEKDQNVFYHYNRIGPGYNHEFIDYSTRKQKIYRFINENCCILAIKSLTVFCIVITKWTFSWHREWTRRWDCKARSLRQWFKIHYSLFRRCHSLLIYYPRRQKSPCTSRVMKRQKTVCACMSMQNTVCTLFGHVGICKDAKHSMCSMSVQNTVSGTYCVLPLFKRHIAAHTVFCQFC